jgi:hypothetical protein
MASKKRTLCGIPIYILTGSAMPEPQFDKSAAFGAANYHHPAAHFLSFMMKRNKRTNAASQVILAALHTRNGNSFSSNFAVPALPCHGTADYSIA